MTCQCCLRTKSWRIWQNRDDVFPPIAACRRRQASVSNTCLFSFRVPWKRRAMTQILFLLSSVCTVYVSFIPNSFEIVERVWVLHVSARMVCAMVAIIIEKNREKKNKYEPFLHRLPFHVSVLGKCTQKCIDWLAFTASAAVRCCVNNNNFVSYRLLVSPVCERHNLTSDRTSTGETRKPHLCVQYLVKVLIEWKGPATRRGSDGANGVMATQVSWI